MNLNKGGGGGSVYEADIPSQFDTLYLRNISYQLCDNSDKKLMLMLLVPKKKKKSYYEKMAKNQNQPQWIDVVHDLCM